MRPNYVTTRCTVTGDPEEIKSFIETMFVTDYNKNGVPRTQLDFSKAIPMPEILRETVASNDSEEGAQLLRIVETTENFIKSRQNRKFEHSLSDAQIERMARSLGMTRATLYEIAVAYLEKNPDVRKAGETYLKAFNTTGFKDWNDWSIAYWGTKWGRYEYRVESFKPFEFYFAADWCFPIWVFKRLTEMYPKVHFYCRCHDVLNVIAGSGYFNPPRYKPHFDFTEPSEELSNEVCYGDSPPPDEVCEEIYYGSSYDFRQDSIPEEWKPSPKELLLCNEVYYDGSYDSRQSTRTEERKPSLKDRISAAKDKVTGRNSRNISKEKTADAPER